MLTNRRLQRLKDLASKRQANLTVLLENVHDPHNISAVLRSADAVGLYEVYLLYTDPKLQKKIPERFGKKSSGGADRWVKKHIFTDLESCLLAVREKYDAIFATHLYEYSESIYDISFTQSNIVIAFGNEHEGISKELLAACDGNIVIPQYGMSESLNISVACAVTLFEALRQKTAAGHYEHPSENYDKILQEFIDGELQKKIERSSGV